MRFSILGGTYWTIPGTVKKAHKGKTKTNSRTGNSITFGIPMWWWLACMFAKLLRVWLPFYQMKKSTTPFFGCELCWSSSIACRFFSVALNCAKNQNHQELRFFRANKEYGICNTHVVAAIHADTKDINCVTLFNDGGQQDQVAPAALCCLRSLNIALKHFVSKYF